MRRIGWGLSSLFFLSGITGLIYQVVWAKHLALVVGNTAHAHAVVLATFMGGLALGNWLWGPYADRQRVPLKLYGWLEIGIGLFGALSPILLALAGDVYVGLAHGTAPGGFGVTTLRILLAVVVLLPPAILMGGTLPTLSRFATESLATAERNVSWLYYLNSAGAVLGALGTGLVLIPKVGLDVSVTLAALMNGGIGVVALVWARRAPTEAAPAAAEGSPPDDTKDAEKVYGRREVWIVYVVIFLSGLVAFGYEIAWIRVLSLVLGSSAHSFSIIVAAFIAGIAVGSYLISRRILPRVSSFTLLGLCELGIATATALTVPLYERLPYTFLEIRLLWQPAPTTFWLYEATKLFICVALLLAPATFVGMTLPLASRVAIGRVGEVGKKVGRVFGINTFGNVLGAAGAGLWLLPILGTRHLIDAGIFLNVAAGLVILLTNGWTRLQKGWAVAGAAGVFLGYLLVVPTWSPLVMSAGAFRWREAPRGGFSQFKKLVLETHELLFYQDDADQTVTVTQNDDGTRILRVNGKADASSTGEDVATQLLLGHLPMILRPAAENALVIGFGSGMTAGAVLRHPVRKVDVSEISSAVVEASGYFDDVNGRPRDDPRLRIWVDDAKSFLRLTDERYDVVISEPSNPWVAGVGALFTTDFYGVIRERLRPGGIMVQWLHTYEMDGHTLKLLLRTFASRFAHVTLWQAGRTDYLLVGSNDPFAADFEATASRFGVGAVTTDLARMGVSQLTTLLVTQVASDAQVRRLAGPGPLNADQFPVVEYEAPKAFFIGKTTTLLSDEDERFGPERGARLLLAAHLEERGAPLSHAELKEICLYHGNWHMRRPYEVFLEAWHNRFPDDPEALWRKVEIDRDRGRLVAARRSIRRLMDLDPLHAPYVETAAELAYRSFRRRRSIANSVTLEPVVALWRQRERLGKGHEGAEIAHRIAKLFAAEARYDQAVREYERAIGLAEGAKKGGAAPLYLELSELAAGQEDYERAIGWAKKAQKLEPTSAAAQRLVEALARRLAAESAPAAASTVPADPAP